jgi:hypothetical protein
VLDGHYTDTYNNNNNKNNNNNNNSKESFLGKKYWRGHLPHFEYPQFRPVSQLM